MGFINVSLMRVVGAQSEPLDPVLARFKDTIDSLIKKGEGLGIVIPRSMQEDRQEGSAYHLLVPELYVLGNFRIRAGHFSLGKGIFFQYSVSDLAAYSEGIKAGKLVKATVDLPVPEDLITILRDDCIKYVWEAQPHGNQTSLAKFFRSEIDRQVEKLFSDYLRVSTLN